jgi:hypothetical protein
VSTLRTGLDVPAQRFGARAHARRGGPARGDPGRRDRRGLRRHGPHREERRDEVSRTPGLGHHGVGKANAERLLEAEQQLDPLEAAEAEVAVERVVEGRAPPQGATTQLGHEPADDVEDRLLDLLAIERAEAGRAEPRRPRSSTSVRVGAGAHRANPTLGARRSFQTSSSPRPRMSSPRTMSRPPRRRRDPVEPESRGVELSPHMGRGRLTSTRGCGPLHRHRSRSGQWSRPSRST